MKMSDVTISRPMTALFLVAGLAMPVVGRSEVVFGNLGSDGSGGLGGTNTDVTLTDRLAVGFSTGSATNRTLQSVTLGLFYDVSSTSSFSLSIYDDNGSEPGSLVATSTAISIGNTGKYTFAFANDVLQASQTYWIVPEPDLSWYTNAGFTNPTGQNSSG